MVAELRSSGHMTLQFGFGHVHKIVLANKAIAVIEDRHPSANELRRVRKAG
jgi:hypothetical protein